MCCPNFIILYFILSARRFYFSRGESGESRTILHFIHYAGSKLMIFHYSVKCLCDRIAIVNFMHDLSIVLSWTLHMHMHLIDSCKCIKVFAAVCLFTDLWEVLQFTSQYIVRDIASLACAQPHRDVKEYFGQDNKFQNLLFWLYNKSKLWKFWPCYGTIGTLAQQEINLIGPQISLPLTGYFAFLGNDEIILYHDFER
jgi:hypothetical protein